MRCNNCTTELRGNPSVCPVCGTPTSPRRAPRAQTTDPLRPPRSQPPAPEPPAFFNAADLIDPEVLGEVIGSPAQPRLNTANSLQPQRRSAPASSQPAAPGSFLNAADLFDPDLFDAPEPSAAPEAQTGQINAADLFDPEVLEQLAAPEEAPPEPPHLNASELLDTDLLDEHPAQAWAETDTPEDADWLNDLPSYKAPSSPLQPPAAAPLLNLPPLAPEAPPRRPSQPRAPRSAGPPPTYAPDPLESDLDPIMERGWRIVAPAPPPGPIPPGPRPARQRRPPPPQPIGRRLMSALGKTTALLLVLGIIGIAILVGYTRCQQLDCWQSLTAPSTALPTVTPIPGFASYQDAQLGIVLEYPKDWQLSASHRADDARYHSDRFSASSYAWLEVGTSPQYSGWSADQINAATITSIKALPNIIGLQTWVPNTATTHIDGQDWAVEDALFTLQDGTSLQLTTLALLHNGHGYVIFYQAHQEEFTHFSTQYFEPMLLSFRFLSN